MRVHFLVLLPFYCHSTADSTPILLHFYCWFCSHSTADSTACSVAGTSRFSHVRRSQVYLIAYQKSVFVAPKFKLDYRPVFSSQKSVLVVTRPSLNSPIVHSLLLLSQNGNVSLVVVYVGRVIHTSFVLGTLGTSILHFNSVATLFAPVDLQVHFTARYTACSHVGGRSEGLVRTYLQHILFYCD